MATVKAYGGGNDFIFVSYKHEDKDAALPIVGYLQRRGYNVWFDEGITPGKDWAQVLGSRIENCTCFLVFVSARSIASPECEKEVKYAFELDKPMVSVFLEPIDATTDVARQLLKRQGIEKFKLESESAFYLKLLEHDLFEPCRDTEEFQVDGENLIRYNGDSPNVVVPVGITQIGYNAFEGNAHLQWVSIPAPVDRIGKFAFNDTPALHEFEVSPNNGFFKAMGGILYNKSGNYLLCYPAARPGEAFEVPEGVKHIGMSAFAQASSLISVTLPESLTYLGDRAFESCRNLIEMKVGGSVARIRPYTFSRCASLVSCELPDSLERIGDGAFSGCVSLASLDLPASLVKIGEMAFAHCSSLVSVALPTGVTSVSEYCFHECTSLVQADLSSATKIRSYAFKNCESLESVTFSDSLTRIGRAAFSGCKSLTSVRIPASVKVVGDYSFDRCDALEEVVVEDGVTEIMEGAFDKDVSLKRVELPPSVEKAHPKAFPEWTEVVYL